MNRWTVGAALMLIAALVGCGNNNTKAGIVITAASATTGAGSVTVPVNGTEQFAATVTGVSDTIVNWQVCLPSNSTTVLPTSCTTIPGVTLPKGNTVLTGYGTINQNGFYTAPAQIPNNNNFVILATSPVDTTTWATFGVVIDSGIRVQITPTTSTISSGDSLQLTAIVTGTSNRAVTWEVGGVVGGDPATGATITTSGLFMTQTNASGTFAIAAVAGADGTTTGAATVTLDPSAPSITSMEPQITEQGAAQQEIYLTGANFTSDGTVLVNGTPVAPIFITADLLRVPIPGSALATAGNLPIKFQTQQGQSSNIENLDVASVRPSIVGYTPQSFSSSGATASVTLTGGYFTQGTPATTAQFDNGNEGLVAATVSSNPRLASRQMSVTLPSGAVSVPGLYPLTVQNSGVPAAMAGVNIAVTPASIPSAPGPNATISLGGGTAPSAIALDSADGWAVVAEAGSNSVAIVNLSTNAVLYTIPVGTDPTGVAVDDLLSPRLALVVNSGDNSGRGSVSVINLSANPPVVTSTFSLVNFTPTMSSPVSIAINPQTHRALVANSSTNLGTVIDLVNPNANVNCSVPPCPLVTVGGSFTGYSTGAAPAIAIDPTLNWAVVTPGGAGSINIVDLGFGSLSSGSGGRAPAAIASLGLSTTVQGVGVNPETHQAIFTDNNTGAVTAFSLLDNTVAQVTLNGTALNVQKESAAAVNPWQNIGVAINSLGSGTASIIDMGNHVVLQTIGNVTSTNGTPSAVAVDPATNEALITNSAAGTVSVVSLGGTAAKPVQILESSPSTSLTSSGPLSMTITGTGFTAGSSVLLDGTALPAGDVTFESSRQILATVPASLTGSARHFSVQVQSTISGVASVSNIEPLILVQAVPVGTSPAGVAVDPYRDVAVVTNSGSDDISVVSLSPPSVSPQSLGPIGIIGDPLPAHLNPRAVAVDPRFGVAVAANFDSNDLSLVDYSELDLATPYSLPAVPGCNSATTCTGPAGIAFNNDNNNFYVTDTNIGTAASDLAFGSVTQPGTDTQAGIRSPVTPQPVDQTPGDIAVAPSFDPFDPINNPNPALSYAAIAASSQTSVVDFLNVETEVVAGRTTSFLQPTGVVYDSLNRAFLVSDSLNNDIVIIDPLTFIPVGVRGGFNPSSIAYNQQTSTVAAVNGATGTLSILDYLCPPLTSAPQCTSPQVRQTMGLIGSNVSAAAPLGPKTVDIDPFLNIAVLVDTLNNRVLLIPLGN